MKLPTEKQRIDNQSSLLDFWGAREGDGNPYPRGSRMARRRGKAVRIE
jgi:hypothetical protein